MRAISLIQGPLRGALVRQTLFVVPSLALAWLCISNLGLAPADLTRGLAEVPAPRWTAAAAFTALSFWVVGRYDLLVHRHLGTSIDPTRATRTGAAAIAISQTTGFGLVVGSLVRWRLLPELGLTGAVRFVALVSGAFLAAWAVLSATAVLLTPALALPVPGARLIAGCVVACAILVIPICLFRPGFCDRLRLPSARTLAAMLPLAAADLIAAAMAFICFLPALPEISAIELMKAFSIAYGVGLLSGSPGGIGPFEVVLLALLPQADPAVLLPAIAGWRMVYFALPALLGLIALARGPQEVLPSLLDRPMRAVDARTGGIVAAAPRAEAGLIHAGHAGFLEENGRPRAVTVRGNHSLVLLSCLDDACPTMRALLTAAAKETAHLPCFYKIDARHAATVRAEGWSVARSGAEAVLDPATWTEAGAARAALRRKLRRAEKAGITTAEIASGDHEPDLARVDAAWCATQGPARGFTMGRYAPDYIARQRVFAASFDGRICAFVTFHKSQGEWVLDLIRHDSALDGTIHALIRHALITARAERCPRLSLAAVPCPPVRLPARLREACALHMGTPGLAQFKSSFGPRWEARYIAAPGPLSLAICWADIARCVQRPPRPAPVKAAVTLPLTSQAPCV